MGRHVPVMLAVSLAACSWRGPKPLQTFPDVDETSSLLALDRPAYKLVAIQKLHIDRASDGRLNLRVELANLSKHDLPVQVQSLFRDGDGMLTGDETPFQMIVLPGNGSKLYEVTSMKPNAAEFTVQVKTP